MLATWRSLLPAQLPASVCMRCLRRSRSRASGVFLTMRSMTPASAVSSTCFFLSLLASRTNAGLCWASSLPLASGLVCRIEKVAAGRERLSRAACGQNLGTLA